MGAVLKRKPNLSEAIKTYWLASQTARVLREGKEIDILISDVVLGDSILCTPW